MLLHFLIETYFLRSKVADYKGKKSNIELQLLAIQLKTY